MELRRSVRSPPAERRCVCPPGPPPTCSSSSWKRTSVGGAACPARPRSAESSPECRSLDHMRRELSAAPAVSSSGRPRRKWHEATPPSCAHGSSESRARRSRCQTWSAPEAAPETSHGWPSVRKARQRTASPCVWRSSRRVVSNLRLWRSRRPSARPTPTTSSAGDCSNAVTAALHPCSNSCTRLLERRFHSCIRPSGAPSSTLLR
mmetsp:Transcript_15425/g.50436  ORF Transcript_15425/g.50436 Transcript_15425/m.50436 type:complete len:206 (+) Transcript_15425:460-1077(+)